MDFPKPASGGGATVTVYEDSALMDGSEQVLVATEISSPHSLEGMIDLSSLASGDSVTVREYMSAVSPVSYTKYAQSSVSGPRDPAMLYLATKSSSYGIRITLQQTSGTYRTLPWQFFLRQEA